MGLKEVIRTVRESLKNFDAPVPADRVDIMYRQIGEEATQIKQGKEHGAVDFSEEHVEPLLNRINESGCFGDDYVKYKKGNLIIGTRYIPVGDVRCIGHAISIELADRRDTRKS